MPTPGHPITSTPPISPACTHFPHAQSSRDTVLPKNWLRAGASPLSTGPPQRANTPACWPGGPPSPAGSPAMQFPAYGPAPRTRLAEGPPRRPPRRSQRRRVRAAGHARCARSRPAPSCWPPRSASVRSSAAWFRRPGVGDEVQAAGVRIERYRACLSGQLGPDTARTSSRQARTLSPAAGPTMHELRAPYMHRCALVRC